MPRVLVTGGTGALGRELVPRLASAGYTVRVMSRRERPAGADAAVEWARAQLRTGEGLAEAVEGADVIAHCASSPFLRTRQVDVEGTRRLLEVARDSGVSHFLYISIVGVDRIPLPYYKHKLATETVIEESGVPFSILRAVQFHTLIDDVLRATAQLPVMLLPTDFKFQLIEPGEVAQRMVEAAETGPGGRLPDIGGPEVHTLGELTWMWTEARGLRRRVIHVRLPGKIASGYRQGLNCAPESRYGSVTWEQWLRRKYGDAS